MDKATGRKPTAERGGQALAVAKDIPQPGETPRATSLAVLTASNSIWNATAFAISLLVTFITTPLYLHRLGESSYGILILVTSILTPLGLLDLGIGPATIKYVAESESVRDRPQSIRYIRSTLLFNLSVGAIGAIVIAGLAHVLTRSVFKIPVADQWIAQISLYWVALRWLALQTGNLFSSIPIALRRYKVYSAGAILASSSIDATGLLALYTGGDLVAVTRAEALTAIVIVGGWILVGRRLLPELKIWPQWHPPSFLKTFRFGFWQMTSNIGALFAHETERVLLGILVSAAAVGYYNVAWGLHVATYSLTYSLGQVLFPTFSHLQGLGQREQSCRMVVQATWLLGILSIGLYVPLFVFARDLLGLWVGPAVAANALGVLRVLALAGMVASLFVVPSFYLMGIGKTTWLAWEAFMQGAITVGVSLALIPSLGLNGAAWGVLASTLSHLTFIYLVWARFLREWISGRVFFSMLAGLLVTAVTLVLTLSSLRQALAWTPTWITLIGTYGLCAILTISLVALVDGALPGGKSRRQETQALIAKLIPQGRC